MIAFGLKLRPTIMVLNIFIDQEIILYMKKIGNLLMSLIMFIAIIVTVIFPVYILFSNIVMREILPQWFLTLNILGSVFMMILFLILLFVWIYDEDKK